MAQGATAGCAAALQKEAFHLAIGFMMGGLDSELGAVQDILATMATSRDERRRPLLRGIGIKYKEVAAGNLAKLNRAKNALDSDPHTESDWELPAGCYELMPEDMREEYDEDRRNWENNKQEVERLNQFFNPRRVANGYWAHLNYSLFHHYVLSFTLTKWSRLRD